MQYTLHGGAKRKKSNKLTLFLGIFLLLGGGYLVYNTLAPALPEVGVDPQLTVKKLKSTTPTTGEDRLYMPQINMDVKIVEIAPGESETSALDRGAVHRAPTSGNPKDGGNYVVAAHRFTMGFTPAQTRAKSPLYHIDEMKTGDEIYVDYSGKRYAYKITEKKTVSPTAVEIERRTEKPQMTIYSCTLSGAADGRVVLVATPVGTVSWEAGKARLSNSEE